MPNGTPWPHPELIEGTIHYSSMASFMDEPGLRSLLVVDRPPEGLIVPQEIAAAATYFRHVLNKDEGDPIRVLGIRTQLNGQPAINIIRA
jgi:hypothetical protein